MPHHGSITSSGESFIRAVMPKFAVISCGKDNSYNHPNQYVVERYESMTVTVLRTDLLGSIVLICDGESVWQKK